MKYCVDIEEVLRRSVVVEAPDASTAKQTAEKLYRDEEVVLGAEDYQGTTFQVRPMHDISASGRDVSSSNPEEATDNGR
jgi:hypothetical protein